MNSIKNKFTVLAITLLLAACGGGGGSAPAVDNPGGTVTTKTATVTFNIISTATLPAPVQGVSLVAFLPAGTTVATEAGSNAISSAALTVGSSITSPLIFGSYSAAANKVKLAVVTTGETFRGGELAKLTVSYQSTTDLTADQFTAPNSPNLPVFNAVGADPVSHSILDLTNKLRAFLGVTFN